MNGLYFLIVMMNVFGGGGGQTAAGLSVLNGSSPLDPHIICAAGGSLCTSFSIKSPGDPSVGTMLQMKSRLRNLDDERMRWVVEDVANGSYSIRPVQNQNLTWNPKKDRVELVKLSSGKAQEVQFVPQGAEGAIKIYSPAKDCCITQTICRKGGTNNDNCVYDTNLVPISYPNQLKSGSYLVCRPCASGLNASQTFYVDPDCAPGCLEIYLGDGECQSACNNMDCFWDKGDCNSTLTPSTLTQSPSFSSSYESDGSSSSAPTTDAPTLGTFAPTTISPTMQPTEVSQAPSSQPLTFAPTTLRPSSPTTAPTTAPDQSRTPSPTETGQPPWALLLNLITATLVLVVVLLLTVLGLAVLIFRLAFILNSNKPRTD